MHIVQIYKYIVSFRLINWTTLWTHRAMIFLCILYYYYYFHSFIRSISLNKLLYWNELIDGVSGVNKIIKTSKLNNFFTKKKKLCSKWNCIIYHLLLLLSKSLWLIHRLNMVSTSFGAFNFKEKKQMRESQSGCCIYGYDFPYACDIENSNMGTKNSRISAHNYFKNVLIFPLKVIHISMQWLKYAILNFID